MRIFKVHLTDQNGHWHAQGLKKFGIGSESALNWRNMERISSISYQMNFGNECHLKFRLPMSLSFFFFHWDTERKAQQDSVPCLSCLCSKSNGPWTAPSPALWLYLAMLPLSSLPGRWRRCPAKSPGAGGTNTTAESLLISLCKCKCSGSPIFQLLKIWG